MTQRFITVALQLGTMFHFASLPVNISVATNLDFAKLHSLQLAGNTAFFAMLETVRCVSMRGPLRYSFEEAVAVTLNDARHWTACCHLVAGPAQFEDAGVLMAANS